MYSFWRIALKFLAQLGDEDAKVFGLLRELRTPDVSEQDAVGKDLACIAGKKEEKIEFFGREVDGAGGDGDGVGGGIDEKIADLDRSIAGALRSAAEMGADAREELLDAEGLGDVVVGAGVEGFHLGVLLIAHGKDEDRGAGFAANGATKIDAGHAGHHEVGDDEVGIPFLKEAQSFLGIVGGADVVTLRGERGAQHASDLNFVVDDEDAFGHGSWGDSRGAESLPGYDRLSWRRIRRAQ